MYEKTKQSEQLVQKESELNNLINEFSNQNEQLLRNIYLLRETMSKISVIDIEEQVSSPKEDYSVIKDTFVDKFRGGLTQLRSINEELSFLNKNFKRII